MAILTLTMTASSSNNGKHKFSQHEEATILGLIVTASLMTSRVETHPQQDNLLPGLEEALVWAYNEGKRDFRGLTFKAYKKLEEPHFDVKIVGNEKHIKPLNPTLHPTDRCQSATDGCFRKMAVRSGLFTEKEAEATWPPYQAKIIRRG